MITTDAVLAAGFHERLVDLLRGITEERIDAADDRQPMLVVPAAEDGRDHFTWRDREDELLAVIRALKGSGVDGAADAASWSIEVCDGREAVVFQRPLPYLYLAHQLFDQAGVPFETHDALPLAAEPYAAAVDLVVDCVTSGYSRPSVIGLLRSPHFAFEHEGHRLEPLSVERLDESLRGARYEGGRDALSRLATEARGANSRRAAVLVAATPALGLMVQLVGELEQLRGPAPAAQLLGRLLSFLTRHQAADTQPGTDNRASKARTAITTGLAELAEAHRQFDDRPVALGEVVSSVRRWIESQTFTPRTGGAGVQLIDADTAPYGRFRELFVVGLVDGDWPAPPARNVLYPTSLLVQLGWPREGDRVNAARARFADLKRLPLERLSLSTFSLEEDAVVVPSSLLEEPIEADQVVVGARFDWSVSVTPDDALALASVPPGILPALPAQWLHLRQGRPDSAAPAFHGVVGPRPPGAYAVTALERYFECPFKYFAGTLLGLGDEPPDQRTLTPQERGLLLHRVLESFYAEWEATTGGAVTLANLDQALTKVPQHRGARDS